MTTEAANKSDIFNPLLTDNDSQRATLARELRVAKGFTLIFALCNSAAERAQQIAALRSELPDLNIQEVPVRTEIPHLLQHLRHTLETPPPDAVFVYGMENWIRSDTNPRSIPFILNLNAARNHFIEDCPCPLILWIPDFLLRQIIGGAPDFASVRSGLYVFAASQNEAAKTIETLEMLGLTEALGLDLSDKHQRIKEIEQLLSRVKHLPAENRNRQDQLYLIDQLATMYFAMGRYTEAESLLNEALQLRRASLPDGHPDIAQSLNNLAGLYYSQGRFAEAEPLYNEALQIDRAALPEGHPGIATDLNNLAELYRSKGRYPEAEPLYHEALHIHRASLPDGHPSIAISLGNLAGLYQSQGRYAEAEPLYHEALQIHRASLPDGHPDIATSLNNLAVLYEIQGRFAESTALYREALAIVERALGTEHPTTKIVRENLDTFLREQGE